MKQIATIALIIFTLLFFSTFVVFPGQKHSKQKSPSSVVGAGSALQFNGDSSYVNAGNGISFGTGDLTLETWVRPEVSSAVIFSKELSGDPTNQFRLGLYASQVFFMMSDKSEFPALYTSEYTVISPGTIPWDEWTHIAAVRSGTWHGLYINGNLVSYYSTSSVIDHENTLSILFGMQGGNASTFFKGNLDDIRIWTTARTQQQIRENMHLRLSGTETGLAGYWRFDEGAGSTAFDNAGSNTGTLNGFDTTTCWVASTAPLGVGTSYSETAFQSGYSTFGGMLALRDSCDTFDNPVDITVTRIVNTPNVVAVGSSTMLTDRYWIVDVFGTPGTYGVDLEFTVPSSFTNNGTGNPSLYSLYKRGSNDDGAWSLDVAGADTVQDTSAYFKCRPSLGQFMLGTNEALPIQLASLTATTTANGVKLEWTTVSETNNYGFYVERRPQSTTTFATVSDLIPGVGTSLQVHQYEWTDMNVGPTTYVYRLKQMDLTGHVAYSNEITVASVLSVNGEAAPKVFQLVQNYPNPFNPTTEIKFSVEKQEHATVKVYSMLGQEVAQLFDGIAEPGHYYKFNFDGSRFGSGMYFYRIITDSHSAVRKMLMLK
ncbi:MAG: LamG-like jellyroll fold domain-containing protein [Bacteroidota bacterium]